MAFYKRCGVVAEHWRAPSTESVHLQCGVVMVTRRAGPNRLFPFGWRRGEVVWVPHTHWFALPSFYHLTDWNPPCLYMHDTCIVWIDLVITVCTQDWQRKTRGKNLVVGIEVCTNGQLLVCTLAWEDTTRIYFTRAMISRCKWYSLFDRVVLAMWASMRPFGATDPKPLRR